MNYQNDGQQYPTLDEDDAVDAVIDHTYCGHEDFTPPSHSRLVHRGQAKPDILPGWTVDDDFIQQQIAILNDLEQKKQSATRTMRSTATTGSSTSICNATSTTTCGNASPLEMCKRASDLCSTMITTPYGINGQRASNENMQEEGELTRHDLEELHQEISACERYISIAGGQNGMAVASKEEDIMNNAAFTMLQGSNMLHEAALLLPSKPVHDGVLNNEGDFQHHDDDEDSFIQQQRAILEQIEREENRSRQIAVPSSAESAACIPITSKKNNSNCNHVSRLADSAYPPSSYDACSTAVRDSKPPASDMMVNLTKCNHESFDMIEDDYDNQEIVRHQQEIYEQIQKEAATERRLLQQNKKDHIIKENGILCHSSTPSSQEQEIKTESATPDGCQEGKEDSRLSDSSAHRRSVQTKHSSLTTRQQRREEDQHQSATLPLDEKESIMLSGPQDGCFYVTKDRNLMLQGGRRLKVKGTSHVYQAIADGTAMLAKCPNCRTVFQIPNSSQALYCSVCHQISHIELCRLAEQQDDDNDMGDEEEDANIAMAVHQQEMYACKRFTKLYRQTSY